MSHQKTLLLLFNKLLRVYGPREWWPAKTRFEVIVGAILTQNVSWKNAKLAIDNLKNAGLLNPNSINKTPDRRIAVLIKSSRFYNQKTEKLKAFSKYLSNRYNNSLSRMFLRDVDVLREELLGIKGIGKETADSILLYAGNKLSFVSDAYTKIFLNRYGLLDPKTSYDQIRAYFMKNIPKDIHLYNEYHALIVHHCYAVCKAKPICSRCLVKKISNDVFCKSGFKYGRIL